MALPLFVQSAGSRAKTLKGVGRREAERGRRAGAGVLLAAACGVLLWLRAREGTHATRRATTRDIRIVKLAHDAEGTAEDHPVDPAANAANAAGTLLWSDVANAQTRVLKVPASAATLADVRAAAEGDADLLPGGGAAWRFLRFERGGQPLGSSAVSGSNHVHGCFYPLSRAEEAAMPLRPDDENAGAYDNGYAVVAERAVQAVRYPDARRRHVYGTYWGGLPRRAGAQLYRQFPPPLCRRWAKEQQLLRRIVEERSFFCDLGRSNPSIRFMWEDRMADAMRSLGWLERGSKSDAVMVVRGGWNWNEIFANTHPGEQLIARHSLNAWFTQKDNLLMSLRRVNKRGTCVAKRAFASTQGALPLTYVVGDPEDCAVLLRDAPPQNGWARKVGDVHIGKGVSMEDNLRAEDRSACDKAVASGAAPESAEDEMLSAGDGDATVNPDAQRGKVMYQARIAPLFLEQRPTSLRVYLIIASYDPLVVLWNHQSGHMYITGRESKNSWYTQHESFESRTFQQVSDFIADEAQRKGTDDPRLASFFARAMLPRIRESLALTAHAIAMRVDEHHGSRGTLSIVRGGDGIGPIGRFDHWCVDFMVGSTGAVRNQTDVEEMASMAPFLLEMSDGCMFKGAGPSPHTGKPLDAVQQRNHFVKDVMELTLNVQVRGLAHKPIHGMIDAESGSRPGEPPTLLNGQFELLLSRQPGSEYDYLDELHGASCHDA